MKKPSTLQRALTEPIQLDESTRRHAISMVFEEASEPILINVENGMTPLAGLQDAIVMDAVDRVNKRPKWDVKTVRLSENYSARQMVESIQDGKICVIDTTHYRDSKNMYVYFFLGLAHGFEKGVIPLINAAQNDGVPFDIHGLWQIHFMQSKELGDWLTRVLPEAIASIETQERDYLYKQMWSPFIEARRADQRGQKKSLHVMTCARNVKHPERGHRTNIDRSDFTTVADLSYFIGETAEYAKVQIEPPTVKRTIADLTTTRKGKREINKVAVNRLCEEMYTKFNELKGNWLIVGAPDSSDYAEVVLALAHGIDPYSPEQSRKNLPFVFVKNRGKDNPLNISSFYESPSDGQEMIRWLRNRTYDCSERRDGEERKGVTHGVITILNKPVLGKLVNEQKKFMILSGFTGIATYAMLGILTDEKYKSEYIRLLKEYNEMRAQQKNVDILVTANYCCKQTQVGAKLPGDTRELTDLVFKDIHEIPFQSTSGRLASGTSRTIEAGPVRRPQRLRRS